MTTTAVACPIGSNGSGLGCRKRLPIAANGSARVPSNAGAHVQASASATTSAAVSGICVAIGGAAAAMPSRRATS
eukprot:4863210-Pyramimonas_sp.AAC.1